MPFAAPIEQVSFVAVDLETTGLAPGFDRIIEVGLARFRVRRDGTVAPGPVLEALVSPQRPVPQPVQALTGISDADLEGAPGLAEVWPRVGAFLAAEAAPTVLVAHNARFDLSFLVAAADEVGRAWDGPPALCTVQVARRALPEAPRYGLEALVTWLGGGAAEGSVHHRALADALHARNLLARCVAARGARSLADLGVKAGVPVPRIADLRVELPERLRGMEPLIERRRPIELVYRGGSKGRARRPLTPLSFYRQDGVLYLRAWCHVDDVSKSFRADRIVSFSG